MSGYNNVFGNDTVPPSGQTFRAILLTANVTLNWPQNYEGTDYLADLMEVTPSGAGLVITLPAANAVSAAQDFLVRNVGASSFDIKDNSGGVLATIAAGEAKYFYLKTNNDAAGTWGVFTFGTGTSSADASALNGKGLKVIGSTLNTAHPVMASASNTVISATNDRAKVYAFTGGAVTVTLPTVVSTGDDFYFGIHNNGTGAVTINPQASEFIDGLATMALAPGESVLIFCSGAAWYTIGYGRSTQFQFTKLVKDVTAGGSFTLTSSEASNKLMQFIGTPGSNVTITLPAIVGIYYIQNAYTGSATLTLTTGSGTSITTNNTDRIIAYCDGVNVVNAQSAAVGTNLSIVDGSAGNPAINFASDTDTGLFRAGVNSFGIAAGGAEVGRFNTTGFSTGLQITSTLATGTAPFVVASTTVVTNLNADRVDGFDLNQDVRTTAAPTFLRLTSTQATGTAPFAVASSTQVDNLNANFLQGGTWASPGNIGTGSPAAVNASGGTLSAMTASGTWVITSGFTVTRGSQGPVVIIDNGANSNYLEFKKTGYNVRGSVGALGAFEMNMSYNMDYATGVHRFYDNTIDANWIAMNENGVYLQYAPNTTAAGDVWAAGGNLYNWYVLNNGNCFHRGNGSFGDNPVSGARLYVKGSTADATGRGFYATDSNGVERLQQYNNGKLVLTSAGTLTFDEYGRLYGSAFHNNAQSPTGTTTQYIASGTYTPTLTGTTNVAASTTHQAQWMRVGNVVTVTGLIQVDPTATGATSINISLPIASNFTTVYQCGGTATSNGVAGQSAGVYADTSADAARMEWVAVDTTNQTMCYSFSYEVL